MSEVPDMPGYSKEELIHQIELTPRIHPRFVHSFVFDQTGHGLIYHVTTFTKSANKPYAVSSGPPCMPSRSEMMTE